MKKVQIVTDGSCLGNPGPGGWACLLRCGAITRELTGFEKETTNNRMELMAAIRGLSALKESCEVEAVVDSQYVVKGVTEYLDRWKANGWRTAQKKSVVNQELWEQLDAVVRIHKVRWTWVKGHENNVDQNRCDVLAQMAARTQMAVTAPSSS